VSLPPLNVVLGGFEQEQCVQVMTESMFSRYLFIQLDDQSQNWGTIRSTLGVSKRVSSGPQPAKVPQVPYRVWKASA